MARQSDVDAKTGGYKGNKKFGAGGTKEGASGKKKQTAADKARAAREKSSGLGPASRTGAAPDGAPARRSGRQADTTVSEDLPAPSKKVRKNTLDEMTVGRTEVPLGQDSDPVKPVVRGKIGAGSYEDPADEKKRRGRPKKSGRPGQ